MADEYRITDFKIGDIVEGTIVLISNDTIYINIGAKSEAELSLSQLPNASVDDAVSSMLIGKTKNGSFELSYEQAQKKINIEKYQAALGKRVPLTAMIKESVKGGILLYSGVRIFIPASHISYKIRNNIKNYINKDITFFVIDKSKEDFIGSQLQYEQHRIAAAKKDFWDNIDIERVYKPTVQKVYERRVFVKTDFIDGFITAKNFSYELIYDLRKYVKKGDELEAKIISYDREKETIEFSRKGLLPDPESDYLKKYKIGSIQKGEIMKTFNNFAIMRFDNYVQGKLELDDISWSRKIRSIKNVIKPGSFVSVKLLSYNKPRREFNVGLKQIVEDPWENIEQKYPVGSVVSGKIIKKIEAGLFINLETDLDAFISKKDMTWEGNATKLLSEIKKDKKISAVVREVNQKDKILRLGIKQLAEDPFIRRIGSISKGQKMKVKIKRRNKGGFELTIADKLEGFLPFREVAAEEREKLGEGDEIVAVIKEINLDKHKILLSAIDLTKKETEERLKSLKKNKPVKFGDLWKEILEKGE